MAWEMDLWHGRLALSLAMSGLALTTTGLIIGIHVANTTCRPNFSLLIHPHGQEVGPVALQAGPSHVWAGPDYHWHYHWHSCGQGHLHAKFQPSSPSQWPRRWTCGTLGQPWPCQGRP